MGYLDKAVTQAQQSLTNALKHSYQCQKKLPGWLQSALLGLEALQLLAFGLVASGVPDVAGTVGILLVPPMDVFDPASHAVAFWTAFGIALAFVLLFVVQVALAEVETPRVGLVGKAQSFLSLVMRRVALYWIVSTSVRELACSPLASAHRSSSMAVVCSDPALLSLATAVTALTLTVVVIAVLVLEVSVFDLDLLSLNPLAASHGRAQAAMVLLKVIAAAILGAVPSAIAPAVRTVTAVALGALTACMFFVRAPYAHRRINALFVAAGTGLAWASLVGVLPTVSGSVGTLMPVTFGTALAFLAAYAWTLFALDGVASAAQLDGSGGTTALSTWYSIMWVRDRLRAAAAERRKESALGFSREARKAALAGTAIATAKPKTSVIEDLVASTASLAGLAAQSSVAAAAAVGKLDNRQLTRAEELEREALLGVAYIEDVYADVAVAQIVVSRFWNLLFNLSHFKERQALTTAKTLSSSFDIRFFFVVCMDAIRSTDQSTSAAGRHRAGPHTASKDIFDRARFERAHETAITAMLKAYEAQNRVMRLVAAGQYDFGSLHAKVALGFGRAMARAHAAVEDMLAVNSDSSQALILAIEFYMELAGDLQRATELQQRNCRLVDNQRRQAERKVAQLAFGAPCEEISPTDETNAVFTIATEPARLGHITAYNSSAVSIFGRTDFLGENISSIIPQPIAAVHDRFLQRFLRTGTARLLDSTRFLVARHTDATIFPVRFRLFETPPSSSDVRPKLTGIISTVNSEEGFVIVGDNMLDFMVTAACRRTCDLSALSGHDVEHGALHGSSIFPELFSRAEDPKSRGGGVAGAGAMSVAQRSVMPGRTVGSGARRGAAPAQLEGVPEWAADMPRKLQLAFHKATRVHLYRPAVTEAVDSTSRAEAGSAASADGDDRSRRPSIGDDLLEGLLREEGHSTHTRSPIHSGLAPAPHAAGAPAPWSPRHAIEDAIPVTVRCYAMPKPVPTDPAGVLVCWTRRDQGKAAATAAASRKSKRGPGAKAAAAASGRRPGALSTGGGAAQSAAGDPSEPPPSVYRSRISEAALAAKGGAPSRPKRGSVASAVGSVHGSTADDGNKSMSSFSSVSARKAARRRIEALARHPSRAISCLKLNTAIITIASAALMIVVMTLTGDNIARLEKHESSVIAALELTRLTETSVINVHAAAAYAESFQAGTLDSPRNSTAIIARADGSEHFRYEQWPVTSSNATWWRVEQAARLQFSASRAMIEGAREVSPLDYQHLTEDNHVCAVRESPDVVTVPGHYPIRMTAVDLSEDPAAARLHVFGPNCTGVGMSVANLLDTTLAAYEALKLLNESTLRASNTDARFVIANGGSAVVPSVNDTVEQGIVELVKDMNHTLEYDLRILAIVYFAVFVAGALASLYCAQKLTREQRLILKILFNVPRAVAKAVHSAAVERYRDLKKRKAALQGPDGRRVNMSEEVDEVGPAESSSEESEGEQSISAPLMAGPTSASFGPARPSMGTGALQSMNSMAEGQREALQFAVAHSGPKPGAAGGGGARPAPASLAKGSSLRGSRTASAGARHGQTRTTGSMKPFQQWGQSPLLLAAAAAGGSGAIVTTASSRGRPMRRASAGGDFTAIRSGEEEDMGSGLSADEGVPDSTGLALAGSVGQNDSISGRGRRGSIQSMESLGEGTPSRAPKQSDAAQLRSIKVTDRRCYASRLGLCTALPGIVTAAWVVSVMVVQQEMNTAIVNDIQRATHALELSVWVGKHAHAVGWGGVDPSVQADSEEGAAARAAVLRQMASHRRSIEFRAGLLLHGGESPLEQLIQHETRSGWLSELTPRTTLPAAAEGSHAFNVLTENACPSIQSSASGSYFNSDGRTLITSAVCEQAHDGVLARGLSTAISRLLSRSRSLTAALQVQWESHRRLRVARKSPSSTEGAAVNVTAERISTLEMHDRVADLSRDILQLTDPWLQLALSDLGVYLAADMKAIALNAWSLQRDLTISAAVLICIAIVAVFSGTFATTQAAIRSARRLLHFIPEAAYKHTGVAIALDTAFESMGILMLV
ncbi:hypothetical protein FNF29_01507 [Cafeteria roenbergensis]|uniref:PAS domain-containing protein n=1 Tax=Cafeteria roenbergensis TaxID=33653 RepID=A0A5A8CTT0_CAFRO|nr:hypothetical protein FNF29_01507 [Cafeteria roenbergensis]|eukprot:KAA0155590.1 hypothetical protein FNF29_01507 [Cafeteria roenbergensis]